MTDATTAPRLLVNVWARQQGYGPGFGDTVPPAEVWPEIDADAWVVAPEFAEAPTPGAQMNVHGDPNEVTKVVAGAFGTPPADLQRLAALPDDKSILLGFADDLGLDVDRRKGAVKLRAEIQEALAERLATEATLDPDPEVTP